MDFEIAFIVAIFAFTLLALLLNPKKSVYLLLTVSVLLHKELFSIYSWNILPIRVVMGAVLVFVVIDTIKTVRLKGPNWLKEQLTNPVAVSLLAFLMVAGFSMIFTKNLKASLSVYAFFATIVALYFYFAKIFEGDKHGVLKVVKAYIIVAFVLSLIGFIQIWVFENNKFIFGAFWNIPGHTPRIGSLFWDVNHFAGLLVLLLPVVGSIIITSDWKQKLKHTLMSLSIFITLVLTNARSGWIAGGCSFLIFILILVFRKYRYRGFAVIFATLLTVSGGILSQYLDKQSPIRREIRQYFHYRLDSFDSHFLLLTGAWQVFEKYPILGGGYGGFFEHFSKAKISATFFARDPAALNTRVPAHSIWGELLAETGIIGTSVMVVFYATVVFTLLYASLRLKNRNEFITTSAMAGSVIGILIAGIFYSYNSEFFWIVLFMYFLYALYCLHDEFSDRSKRLWVDIYSFFISNPKFPVTLLFALSAGLIFVNLGKNHLIPYDEAIYAKVSQNILQRNDWLTLSWRDNQPWFEKPPLYFWLSALSLQLLPGSPELAVRLPSALFGLFAVMLTYVFGRKLFGKTAGFIAGFSLLTTFHFLYYSRIGMLDVACGFFILAALYFYYRASEEINKFRLILAGIFLGMAVLTKGVVGFLPLIVIVLYECIGVLKLRLSVPSVATLVAKILIVILTSVVIFLPWHLIMYQLHGQAFINNYLGYHVLSRVTLETENKTGPIYWYLIVLKVSMRLWFVALLPAFLFTLLSLVKNRYDRTKLGYVLLWALVVLIVFSFSKTKLVWYIIPIYASLAILLGYFYSSVLSFADLKLSRLKHISSFFLKTVVLYLTICIVLLYLLSNKNLVYTSDLTGSQAQMMQLKNTIYGPTAKVFLDRIESPLALFYVDGPFEITDFTPLKLAIYNANKEGDRLIFITKESRFKQLQKEYSAIKLASFTNEWYLGELVAQ